MYQPVQAHDHSYHQPPSPVKYPTVDDTAAAVPPPSYSDSTKFTAASYRDLPWAALFIAQLLLVVCTGCYLFFKYSGEMLSSSSPSSSAATASLLSWPVLALLLLVFALAAGIALSYLSLMRLYPAFLIRFTLYLSAAMLGVSCLFSLLSGNVAGAMLTGVLLALQVWYIFSVQSRIAFSALILETAVTCLQLFPSTLLVALVGIVAQCVWLAVWLLSASSIYYALTRNLSLQHVGSGGEYDGSDPTVNVVLLSLVLSYYWTVMTITYVVHCTVAGVAAAWYFLFPTAAMPSSPTLSALKRAVTLSFGSICLGALIIAVVKTARALLSFVAQRRQEDRERSVVVDCLLYCAQCLLSLLDSVLEYINTYAFSRCAVYGEPFCQAASRSLELLQLRGLDAVVNDSLIGNVLQLGALVCGLCTAVIASSLSWLLLPAALQASGVSVGLIATISFFLGLGVTMTAAEAVNATVVALFVCLAEDPAALARTKPAVYERLVSSMQSWYPQLQLDTTAARGLHAHDLESQYGKRGYGGVGR